MKVRRPKNQHFLLISFILAQSKLVIFGQMDVPPPIARSTPLAMVVVVTMMDGDNQSIKKKKNNPTVGPS